MQESCLLQVLAVLALGNHEHVDGVSGFGHDDMSLSSLRTTLTVSIARNLSS